MTTTLRAPGKIVNVLATTALTSSIPVQYGNKIAIPIDDIANGATGGAYVSGQHVLPAVETEAFVVGDQLYYDTTALELVKTPNANTILAGTCAEPKASAGATGEVNLNGQDGRMMPNQADSAAGDLAAQIVLFNLLLDKLKDAGFMVADA